MSDDTKQERRGRPPKALDGETFLRLLAELGRGAKAGTFAQACERAGTSTHVVKKAMRDHEAIDFEIRVACLARGRKKLCDRGADPELLYEAGKEAALIDAGDVRREWPEVQAAIEKRRGIRMAVTESRSRAGAQVTIPAARTPEEENF